MQDLTQAQSSQNVQCRTELPQVYTDRIFARLTAMYGHKFTSLFKSEDQLDIAQIEWSKALAPMSDNAIANGLDRCKYLADWNPSISEFVRIAYELPTRSQCIARCLQGTNLDEVSYIAYHGAGGRDGLSRITTEQIQKRISNQYEDAYETVLKDKLANPEKEQVLVIEYAESDLTPEEKRDLSLLRRRADKFDYVVDANKPLEEIEEEVSDLERLAQMKEYENA